MQEVKGNITRDGYSKEETKRNARKKKPTITKMRNAFNRHRTAEEKKNISVNLKVCQ